MTGIIVAGAKKNRQAQREGRTLIGGEKVSLSPLQEKGVMICERGKRKLRPLRAK